MGSKTMDGNIQFLVIVFLELMMHTISITRKSELQLSEHLAY